MRATVWILVAALTHSAWGASFDCRKASQPQERAICSQPELSHLDEQLAAAYSVARGRVSAAAAEALRGDQRMWLRYVGTVCEAAKEKNQPKLAACMLDLYKSRAEELGKAVKQEKGGTFYTRSIYLAEADGPEDKGMGYEDHPGFGTLTAAWPQRDSSEAEWTAWNEEISRKVRQMVGDSSGPWTEDLAGGADDTISAQLVSQTPEIVSVALEMDEMGHGAAHPNSYTVYAHWLLKERRELRVEDVFTGLGWKSTLAKRCWSELELDPGADSLFIKGPDAGGLLDVVGAPQNWSFDRKGLTMHFPTYSVSPRSNPAPDVTVPWTALKPFLAASSPVGQ